MGKSCIPVRTPSLLMHLITRVISLYTSSRLLKRFPWSGFFNFGKKSKAGRLTVWRVGKHLPSIFFLSSTTLSEFWLAQLLLSMVSFPVPSVSNYLLPSSSNHLSRHHHPILILAFLSVLLRVVSIYKCF